MDSETTSDSEATGESPAAEMVPLPSEGRVFTHVVRVSHSRVGPEGVAHLDAVADWLQEAAYEDAVDADLVIPGGWVIRRLRIVAERLPVFGERLELRTFCAAIAASVAERRTSIRGDAGAAIETTALWVHVDPETRRPARFRSDFVALYGPSAAGRRARSSIRHPSPSGGEGTHDWQFRAADIDLAGHVNNAVYWQIAEQFLPGAAAAPFDIEAGHRNAGAVGPARVLVGEQGLWVEGPDGEPQASFVNRDG